MQAGTTADALHFAYATLTGDGQIIVRLRGFQLPVPASARAGLMLRADLTPEAAHGAVLLDLAESAFYVSRAAAGQASTSVPARGISSPQWLKIIRTGNEVAGLVSSDGISWTCIGQSTLDLPATVYVGLASTSGADARLVSATFDQAQIIPGTVVDRTAPELPSALRLDGSADSFAKFSWKAASDDVGIRSYGIYEGDTLVGVVPGTQSSFVDGLLNPSTSYRFSVRAFDLADHAGPLTLSLGMTTAPATLPLPWRHNDVGAVGAGGSALLNRSTFTLKGAGMGEGDQTDSFHFAYQNLVGDGELVTRVEAVGDADSAASAGVMLRPSLDQDAPYAAMSMGADRLLSFQARTSRAGASYEVSASVVPKAFPYWIKIKRVGANVFGYFSADGAIWTLAGVDSVPLDARNAYVGLTVASGEDPDLAAARFDSVSVHTEPITDFQAPDVPGAPTLAEAPGSDATHLTWAGTADNVGVTAYRVWRGGAVVATVAALSYVDAGLAPNQSYSYHLQAVDNAGNVSAMGPVLAVVTTAPSDTAKDGGRSNAKVGPVTSAVPSAPTGLTAVPGNAQVALSWTAVSGATGYSIKRAGTSGGSYTAIKTGQTTASYTNTGLTNGTTYYYVVTATNASGESANSSQVNATPVAPPAAPTGLAATPGNAQVTLSWSAVSGATGYSIKYATKSGGAYTTAKTGQTSSPYTVTGLTNGTKYYFVVSATNAGGESANSSEVSATPAVPLAAPSGLSATPGNAQATLSWSAVTGAASYTIKRAMVNGGPYTAVKTGQTTTSYVDTGLANGTTYYYVVCAIGSTGVEGTASAQVSVTPVAPPAAPAGLTATAGNAQVALSWTAVSGATSYSVGRANVSGGSYTAVKTGLASPSYTDTGLANGTTYYYVVNASNAGGTSSNSAQVSATPATPPATPTGLAATPGNAQVALSWTAVSGATSYSVSYSTTSGSNYSLLQSGLTSPSYTKTGLANGTTYYFVVSATNASGSSANSTQVSATPIAPPATPAAPSATPGNAQVTLTWPAVAAATSYSVGYANRSGGPYTVAQSGITSTSYTKTSLANGTTYYFVVTATNAGGTSANSTQVSATPVAPPAAPTGLAAAPGNAQVVLSWTAASSATGYSIKRAMVNGGPYNTVKSGQTTTSYTDSALTNGTTYYYVVSATNGGGESANSTQVTVQPTAPQAMVAQGSRHTLRLHTDGTVWTSGSNYYGQLGQSDRNLVALSPVVLSALSSIKAIAAGDKHNVALKSDGSVYTWGYNSRGQLGDGSTYPLRTAPYKVTALTNAGIAALSAGYDFTLVLSRDGTMWSFGGNDYGQLGNNTTTSSNVPVHLTSPQNITAISAGFYQSVALQNNGQVYTWGDHKDNTNQLVPTLVSGLANITAVSAGFSHCLALDQSGRVWAWGRNPYGELGNGTTTDQVTPTIVAGLSNIVVVWAGNGVSLALRNDGAVYTWGYNAYGQLGNGTSNQSTTPTLVTGLPTNLASLGNNGSTSAALTTTGVLWCWGTNGGMFGDGVSDDSLVPINVDAPVITSANNANAITWQGFSYQITATNTPTSYSASGLPSGLTLNTATGSISGTPITGGTASFTIKALNAAGSGAPLTFTLTTRSEPNLAYNASATASSSGATTQPGAAIDGDAGTSWTSAAGGSQSIVLDLGSVDRIDAILLNWDTAAGKDYVLQVSPDNTSWTTVQTITGNTATGVLVYSGLNANGRYVRLSITAGVNSGGYALREFQVFGSQPVPALTVTGVRLHLQADLGVTTSSGSITQWSDQSGLHNDAVTAPESESSVQFYSYTQPALIANGTNGQPVVHFGPGGFMDFSSSLFNGISQAEVIIVLRASNAAYDNHGLWCLSDGNNHATITDPSSDSYFPYTNGVIYETFGTAHQHALRPSSAPLNQFNVYDVSAAASGSWIARLNEQVLAAVGGNTPYFNASVYHLGTARDNSRSFSGDVAEMFIFDHALSSSERLAVERYAAIKYGLVSPPTTPTALTAQAISPTQIALRWQYPSSSPSATLFTIKRAAAGTSNYQVVGTADNVCNFIDNTAAAGSAYVYCVVATDLAGDPSTPSAAATVSTPTTGKILPTNGLALRLAANLGTPASGSVSTWADSSGNGNDAQQSSAPNQPTVVANAINGLPAVHFEGVNSQWLALPDFLSSSSAAEMFTVHRSTALAGTTSGFHSFSGYSSYYPWYTPPGGSAAMHDGCVYDGFGSDVFAENPSKPIVDIRQFHLFEALSQPGQWNNRMNGSLISSSTNNPVSFNHNPLLGSDNGVDDFFSGDVAEILIYNRALTEAERSAVDDYLAVRYLLPDMDPDHDGLTTGQELAIGTDPLNPDTNHDGILDGQEYLSGLSPTNMDMDGDGISNAQEILNGTNPFDADTDHDGVPDNLDYYPLDPTRSQAPMQTSGVPVLTLSFPPGAVLKP